MSKKSLFGVIIGAALGVLLVISLASQKKKPPRAIEEIQEQYESELMAIDGVVGVGIGTCKGDPCIKVYVENKYPDLEAKIPKQLNEFKVDTEVTGPIEAFPQ